MAYLARKPIKRAVSRTTTMPAPTGGWNARDALSAMKPEDAVQMVNWFPGTSDVYLRPGRELWAYGAFGTVETLMAYNSPTATKLFAAADSRVYDVSTSGLIGLADVTGLTNARWQYVNMQSSGGVYAIMAVNGADKLIGYDGSAWWQDGDGTHDITGVDTADIVQCNVHKFRYWMVEQNTLDAWYLPTGAISGAATKFSLAGTARSGGYLVAMSTWTIDAGYGVDDNAVFITSKGEMIVYTGTNPAVAADWQLIGVWQLGSPIGRRPFVKWKGDLAIICHDGLVPRAADLQSTRLDPRVALSDKIQAAISAAISRYEDNFGWEVQPYPRENALIVNVPVAEGSDQEQYVMNTITESWCRFTGWDANCFELYNDLLYHGGGLDGNGEGAVYLCWTGTGDQYWLNDGGGVGRIADIQGNLQQAFSYMRGPAQLKRFTLMRPVFSSTSPNPPVLTGLNIDYDTSTPISTLTGAVTGTTAWNTTAWNTALWAGSYNIVRGWQGAQGLGYCCSPHYVVNTRGISIRLMSTDIVYEIGGVL